MLLYASFFSQTASSTIYIILYILPLPIELLKIVIFCSFLGKKYSVMKLLNIRTEPFNLYCIINIYYIIYYANDLIYDHKNNNIIRYSITILCNCLYYIIFMKLRLN